MILGTGGYEFAGYTYGDSHHTGSLTAGCLDCHMATPHGVMAGGHQFGLVYDDHGEDADLVAGCNVAGCHTSPELDDFDRTGGGDYDRDGTPEGVQTEIAGMLAALQAELLTRGLISAEDQVNVAYGSTVDFTETEAGAVYNYLFVKEDHLMLNTKTVGPSDLSVVTEPGGPSYREQVFQAVKANRAAKKEATATGATPTVAAEAEVAVQREEEPALG